MKLSDCCQIEVGMKDADFWIQRTGTPETIGTPHENISLDDIGIKVLKTDLIVPKWLYYKFMHMQMQGLFNQIAVGNVQKSLTLKSIRDIELSNQ